MGTYHRNMVLATYRAEHPERLEPTESTLTEYEENLAETYDEEIRSQAPERGIDPNKLNRSMLVFFANQSTAKRTAKRVEHACTFFLAVTPVP